MEQDDYAGSSLADAMERGKGSTADGPNCDFYHCTRAIHEINKP
jgi:hypothetical protein